MSEFIVTSRLSDLFSVSSSRQYSIKQIISKQTVTVEVLQLKRSMYDDLDGFIFKHFDTYCSLLKQFSEFDASMKMSAFKVLLQVTEKMINTLSSFLEGDIENFEPNTLHKKRNKLKMSVFLLCHFTQAFETEIAKKLMTANVVKGKKKRVSMGDEYSEWSEERVKFLVIVKKLFKLPIDKLWNPPTVESDFVNFVTASYFKLLENAEVTKDKGMRMEIFKFLGTILADYSCLSYSIKIIQLAQDFEHLPSVLADAVVYFTTECAADSLVSDICRELLLLDPQSLVQNLTAAHSLSQFLIVICEGCPNKVLGSISILLQFLEWESHVMRNCVLTILGIIINNVLTHESLTQKEMETRAELLEHIEAHLLDSNSFVRCKAIQALKSLLEEKALTSLELCKFGRLITKRLKDKASNVRKNAMSFLAEFFQINQFSCQVALPVLKESFEKESAKLKQMKQMIPVVFDDSDSEKELDENAPKNAVIFDDSDEENETEKTEQNETEKPEPSDAKNEEKSTDNPKTAQNEATEEKDAPASDKAEDKLEKENKQVTDVQNAAPSTSDDKNQASKALNVSGDPVEALKRQKKLVEYLKNTLTFAEVIHSTIEPIHSLLYSQTQTDVLEAIDFITTTIGSSVNIADTGIKEILKLVWSKEAPVRDAALKAFKSLYLSDSVNKREPAVIAKNLVKLLLNSATDDALNVQEFVKHFGKMGEIPSSIAKVLWSSLTNSKSPITEEEKIITILLLGMLAEVDSSVVTNHFDELIKLGLGKNAEGNYQLAKYTFKTLCKINQNVRGKFDCNTGNNDEVLLPLDHEIVKRIKCLLIKGFTNFEDDQWTPMANEAIACLYSLVTEPTFLCAEIGIELVNTIYKEKKDDEEEQLVVSPLLLSRFLSFCGDVALHYTFYLKVDFFAHLRRQEILKEKRRRKSIVNKHISSLHSTVLSSSPKSAKKRQVNNQKYQYVPPVDEETTYEQVLDMCAKEAKHGNRLLGALLPAIVDACVYTLTHFHKEIQAAASLALVKFMLISEEVCEEKMRLFATIAEKSPEPYIRANMVIAMGDLTTTFPNIVEPWTLKIFQRLSDSDAYVREAALVVLTHLILHDFVRIKSLISEAAKCIADSNENISRIAKYLFTELSKKGNVIYNIIPDIISSLSDPKAGIQEEKFQVILSHMLQYIEKEKLVEGLVEKLCCRFTDSSTQVQIHELTFCLSVLTLNDKCYSKLLEFRTLLKEKMSDPVIMKYITSITANAKKNDAKTAAELEAFRTALNI